MLENDVCGVSKTVRFWCTLYRQLFKFEIDGSFDIICCEVGVICAAPRANDWYRAQVMQTYPDTDEYDLKLVDVGGYVHMTGALLRQIRSVYHSSLNR
jgi:hypothetical protein